MTEAQIDPDADWNLIPQHMRDPLRRYVEDHRPPGDFLRAVLGNDLVGAVAHADARNLAAIADWAQFLYNYLPGNCWGSTERVQAWLKGVADGG